MRRCSNCGNQTEPGFTTNTYTRRGLDIEVTISGIPAEVCHACGWAYMDMDTAEEVEQYVLPLFEAARTPGKLPTPKVTIAFSALVPAAVK